MKNINHQEIRDLIYNYKTKYKHGFVKSELIEILKLFPNINMKYFEEAMFCNTCMLSDENEIITYHIDIYKAIICGLKNRGLTVSEWD